MIFRTASRDSSSASRMIWDGTDGGKRYFNRKSRKRNTSLHQRLSLLAASHSRWANDISLALRVEQVVSVKVKIFAWVNSDLGARSV